MVFEVFDAVGGEMTALSQLAKVRDVAGITGYFIEPELDVTKYPEFSAAVVNAVLVRVVSQMDKSNRGQS